MKSFHFSIGRINPVLYALVPGTWNLESYNEGNCQKSNMEAWMRNYVDALCINSWQVLILLVLDIEILLSEISFSWQQSTCLFPPKITAEKIIFLEHIIVQK